MRDMTSDPRARRAIDRAHRERSKLWAELWDFLTRR